jgi:hypothetical protein
MYQWSADLAGNETIVWHTTLKLAILRSSLECKPSSRFGGGVLISGYLVQGAAVIVKHFFLSEAFPHI